MLTERRNIVKISLIRSLRIADTTFLGFKNAKLSIKNKTILDCAKLLNANANHLTDLSISDEDAVTAIALEPFELYFGVRIHKGTPLLPPPTKE
ncbi:MAG: hypothetical protein AB8B83_08100 [Bdellovibrionales bacterium]